MSPCISGGHLALSSTSIPVISPSAVPPFPSLRIEALIKSLPRLPAQHCNDEARVEGEEDEGEEDEEEEQEEKKVYSPLRREHVISVSLYGGRVKVTQ